MRKGGGGRGREKEKKREREREREGGWGGWGRLAKYCVYGSLTIPRIGNGD